MYVYAKLCCNINVHKHASVKLHSSNNAYILAERDF